MATLGAAKLAELKQRLGKVSPGTRVQLEVRELEALLNMVEVHDEMAELYQQLEKKQKKLLAILRTLGMRAARYREVLRQYSMGENGGAARELLEEKKP